MNIRLIGNITGYVLWVEGGFLVLPLLISLGYGDGQWQSFLLPIAICVLLGLLLRLVPIRVSQMQARDGYVTVALCWVVLSVFGSLPYQFSGTLPCFCDAVFETASGLTTTGSTVFASVSDLPRSIQFWRSLTQWMGGMGVLVLFLALMPKLGGGAVYLMRAESPGPIKSKLVPKVSETAKILYGIYLGLTVMETVALRIAGMSWFAAVNHSFTTMATGGFSIYDDSIVSCSLAVKWIMVLFQFLAGVNFSLFFLVLRRRFGEALRNQELRFYTILAIFATALICLNLWVQRGMPLAESFTDAAFQTVTVMTTTGYATADFAMWPTFSRMVLVLLMFTGACAGSTAGGIKISRIMIMRRELGRQLRRILHPNYVSSVTMDGTPVEEKNVSSANTFLVAYLLVLLAGALVVSWDDLGFQESFVASLTCISNVGPALGALGPMANFSVLSGVSKIVLALIMLMGRLELMPILVLMSHRTWKNG